VRFACDSGIPRSSGIFSLKPFVMAASNALLRVPFGDLAMEQTRMRSRNHD